MDRQMKDLGEREGAAGEAIARFGELVERRMAEDLAHDWEALPELKETLDDNRPEYRKLLPEDRAPRIP